MQQALPRGGTDNIAQGSSAFRSIATPGDHILRLCLRVDAGELRLGGEVQQLANSAVAELLVVSEVGADAGDLLRRERLFAATRQEFEVGEPR